MKALALASTLALFLGGCGASDAYRGAIAAESAKGADDFVETARWGLCKAASIGSIRRAYGGSAEQARKYAEFCNLDAAGTAVLIGLDPIADPAIDASGN
jgi:hypothetical protein